MAEGAVARLRYYNLSGFGGLAGRGGNVRFFLLTNGIKFEEEVYDWSDKEKLKAEDIKSGTNPSGLLPMLVIDGQTMSESLAILRYLSKRVNSHTWSPSYGADVLRDYKVDNLADTTMDLRHTFLKSAFGGEDDKKEYLSTQRPHMYRALNALVERFQGRGPYAVGSSASFADAVLFALLWDDVAVYGEDKELWANAPHLSTFYREYLRQEPVLQWCKANRPELCEAAKL